MQGLALESFDTPQQLSAPDEDSYQEGFLAGFEQAQSEHQADQTALRAELVQAISDLQFTYVEARSDFVTALTPLLAAIPESILPTCVSAAFSAKILELLSEAANDALGGQMNITVHPSAFETVQSALIDSAVSVALDQDPGLTPNAIWVGRSEGETLIDLDSISQSIGEILSAITEIDAKRENNG